MNQSIIFHYESLALIQLLREPAVFIDLPMSHEKAGRMNSSMPNVQLERRAAVGAEMLPYSPPRLSSCPP